MNFPSLTYPALTNFQYRSVIFLSPILFDSNSARIWWLMLSKNPFISPSITQVTPFHFLTSKMAVVVDLLGLNPWELLRNRGS